MSMNVLTRAAVEALLRDPSAILLGKGSYGKVYRVPYEGRECVVKQGVCKYKSSSFVDERQVMQRLGGAGGAPIPLGFCFEMPALLMTFCGTKNLEAYLNGLSSTYELPLLYILKLALSVTERLQEIHRAGFVHCDFKSNNVTLKFDRQQKLESVHIIDFGFTCRIGDRNKIRVTNRSLKWYCDCLFTRSPVGMKCDLPGLSTIFKNLFFGRKDIPHRLVQLAGRCASSDHTKRPDLEYVRQCFAKECSQFTAGPIPSRLKRIMSTLDSTEKRKPTTEEVRVLAHFCAEQELPILCIQDMHTYLMLQKPEKIESDWGYTFTTGQKVIQSVRTLKDFKNLLEQAMRLKVSDDMYGTQILEGICLDMLCLVTNGDLNESSNKRSREEQDAAAPAKRSRQTAR